MVMRINRAVPPVNASHSPPHCKTPALESLQLVEAVPLERLARAETTEEIRDLDGEASLGALLQVKGDGGPKLGGHGQASARLPRQALYTGPRYPSPTDRFSAAVSLTVKSPTCPPVTATNLAKDMGTPEALVPAAG